MACQKTFLNISDNSIGDNANAGFLGNNNSADSNTDIDTEAKSNPNHNMTGKDDNDLCKDASVINIEE